MNVAVILAGGVGSRMGLGVPKQFIEVMGKPVLVYTIEKFQSHREIDAIEVVCIHSYRETLKGLVQTYGLDKVRWIAEGGATFQESVRNGIRNLHGQCAEKDVVLVHYGASPLVDEEIISDGIRVCKEKGSCVSANPIYTLTGSNDDGTKSTQWVDRDTIMGLNTPQCHRYGYISWLYREAEERGILEQVEPHTTSLMYRMGQTIYFSKGSQVNIKLTTKEDLDLFEGYLLLQQKREGERR